MECWEHGESGFVIRSSHYVVVRLLHGVNNPRHSEAAVCQHVRTIAAAWDGHPGTISASNCVQVSLGGTILSEACAWGLW